MFVPAPVSNGESQLGISIFERSNRTRKRDALASVETTMAIWDRFSDADVTLGVSARNKRSRLEMMAAKAAVRLGRPEEEILNVLEAREELGSTVVAEGVAIPHAQLPDAASPLVLFARTERPIDFDAGDAEPVDLVFVVLWPAEDAKGLLDAMSEICRALRDERMLRQLRLTETPEDVIRVLQAVPGPEQSGAAVARG